jgi:alkanesulfonate monooxygenase SsuD/methylene tetrahydromethanopterin reductase-like flavin-dependent oxidoreductase (luciferase family)
VYVLVAMAMSGDDATGIDPQGLLDSAHMPSSKNPLRYGLKFSQQVHPIDVHVDVWRTGDEAGFDHIWPFDHLLALGPDPAAPIFDGWTALGSIAVITKRARMGLNVTGNLYRHPGLMAKIAVTVDHVSNGRLEFGIGTGWNEPEFTQFGLPFPSAGDRVTMLDESLKALKLLWSEPRSTFKGRFYELRDAIAEPKPVQRPHPPIWIGSKGERMLRLTARHADVWHSNAGEFEESAALNKALDTVATKVGRDPASIRRSISLRFTTPDETLRKAKASLDAGFTELLLMMGGGAMPVADPRKRAEEAAALLPRLRALG